MLKGDNPVISFFNKITDLVALNLLFILMSIPVFTIGASWTALYYVSLKMVKNEESYIWKDFFKSFKQNFKQATIMWMTNLVVVLALASVFVSIANGSLIVGRVMFILMVNVAVIIFVIMTYVYPVLSHFDNTIGMTIKNAVLLALANLPYTVSMIVLLIFPVVALFLPKGKYVVPVFVLIGFSGPAYLCSFMWKRIFAKLDVKADLGEKNGQEKEE